MNGTSFLLHGGGGEGFCHRHHTQRQPPPLDRAPPTNQPTTEAGGTHRTGMHSCLTINLSTLLIDDLDVSTPPPKSYTNHHFVFLIFL